ncbi:MAG: DUF2125 domain-containing protein [Acetobacteraceae bacterium]|nr:DUF2125 domain-containing protein [Acetobacteraceae bacterium]MBV8590091.1 DUF2125 domain-containing protein [Acetobacteraceae bacterium]
MGPPDYVRVMGWRRLRISGLAILLIAGVGHGVYWRLVANRLAQGWESWLADQHQAGWTAEAGRPVVGGWPMAATLTIPRLLLQGGDPDIPGGLSWSTERVILRIGLGDLRLLQIFPQGLQHLRVVHSTDFAFTARQIRADLPLNQGAPLSRVFVVAHEIRGDVGPEGPVRIGVAEIGGEANSEAPAGHPALQVAASAQAISLPPGLNWVLGSRISSLSFDAALNGPVPTSRSLIARATEWRDEGGTLGVRRFALGWGPLGVSAAARITLDPNLQPSGTGMGTIVGWPEALDALAISGVMTKQAAFAAKAVLGLLARPGANGAASILEVPLTLQDRRLSIGRFPLVRIPELVWPVYP